MADIVAIPPLTCAFEGLPVFTILFALAFSLAVCAVIGVGATTILNRIVAFARQQRERVGVRR